VYPVCEFICLFTILIAWNSSAGELKKSGTDFFNMNAGGVVTAPLVLQDRQQQLLCTEPEYLDADAEQQKSRDPHDDAGAGGAEQPRQPVGVAIA